MMNEFNKERFYNNIEYLLNIRNMGIGEFEAKTGVSTGYMARNKKDEKSKPGIEFIMGAAEQLGVSVDSLLTSELYNLTPTEQYLLEFLCKLHKDTLDDKLEWNRESADYLNGLKGNVYGDSTHVLFSSEPYSEPGETDCSERFVFHSQNLDDHTYIHGDCFNLKMQNRSTLYLMNIGKRAYYRTHSDASCVEVWLCVPGDGKRFLCDNKGDNSINQKVTALYAAISEQTKHPQISAGFRSVIDSFMKDEPIADTDDLPFI